MPTWRALEGELDRWTETGSAATFWWRDDDAGPAGPELRRLLDLGRMLNVGLGLAVVPTWLEESAAAMIVAAGTIDVLQHGYAHASHAEGDAKKSEFPASRPLDRAVADLRAGRVGLHARFGRQAMAVLVPPWNRIAPAVVARLAEAGLTGLSTFGPRAATGTLTVNTHVDVIAWRYGRGFVGEAAALAVTIGHLRARREGEVDRHEPTGLLTHHRVQDEATWGFVGAFVRATRGHPAARWLSPRAAFARAT
ncbi:MAG: hypothetical protein EXQ94_04730 [Alphaproteobacteria bacterium]|nr:hypothetical protein [Alphaproteobacteria bacterium]